MVSEINIMKTHTVTVSFNNGSVPPQYAYRYEIIFYEETANAELKIFKGYDLDEKIAVSESKKFNTDVFQQLLSGLEKINNSTDQNHLVGGSQRSIEVQNSISKKIVIEANDENGISLFNRFLYLYNSDFSTIINKHINQ